MSSGSYIHFICIGSSCQKHISISMPSGRSVEECFESDNDEADGGCLNTGQDGDWPLEGNDSASVDAKTEQSDERVHNRCNVGSRKDYGAALRKAEEHYLYDDDIENGGVGTYSWTRTPGLSECSVIRRPCAVRGNQRGHCTS